MSDIKCDPYFFFKGDCRQAMEFYQGIFGGELIFKTYADFDMVSDDRPAEQIMHAALLGGAVDIMGSDTPQASEKAAKVSISLMGTDKAKMAKIFEGLSQDVEVIYPLKQEVWGDTFGSVVDKFSIEWLINISAPEA